MTAPPIDVVDVLAGHIDEARALLAGAGHAARRILEDPLPEAGPEHADLVEVAAELRRAVEADAGACGRGSGGR